MCLWGRVFITHRRVGAIDFRIGGRKCEEHLAERSSERESGGEGGIRTPGTSFSSYNGLANRRLQPLGHLSVYNRPPHNNLQRV